MNEQPFLSCLNYIYQLTSYLPMETNQPSTVTQTNPEPTAHERAVAIMKRLVADKRQAEKEMVENFHTDPLIQAAVAKLKEENERRGTPVIHL